MILAVIGARRVINGCQPQCVYVQVHQSVSGDCKTTRHDEEEKMDRTMRVYKQSNCSKCCAG
eukprot:COSAG06_NODE_11839_length_1458_cov_0.894776_1_plen_61_part_10